MILAYAHFHLIFLETFQSKSPTHEQQRIDLLELSAMLWGLLGALGAFYMKETWRWRVGPGTRGLVFRKLGQSHEVFSDEL